MMSQSLFQRLFPNYSQDTFKYWWCQVYSHWGISIKNPTHIWQALLPIMQIPYCTFSEQIRWSGDVENSKVRISFDNFRKSSLNFSDLFESWLPEIANLELIFPFVNEKYKKKKTRMCWKVTRKSSNTGFKRVFMSIFVRMSFFDHQLTSLY